MEPVLFGYSGRRPNSKPLAKSVIPATTRRRHRTFQARGCLALPVLKFTTRRPRARRYRRFGQVRSGCLRSDLLNSGHGWGHGKQTGSRCCVWRGVCRFRPSPWARDHRRTLTMWSSLDASERQGRKSSTSSKRGPGVCAGSVRDPNGNLVDIAHEVHSPAARASTRT